MGFDENIEMVRIAFYQVLISSGPFLGAALAIGLIIGIIQAATSIQEEIDFLALLQQQT